MYLVIELQKTAPDAVANIVTAHNDLNVAYQKYFTVLAAAAVSSVPAHTAMLITDTGGFVCKQTFEHDVEPDGGES